MGSETAAVILNCTKCGRPLSAISYFTSGGHYHYECIPETRAFDHPASTAADTGLVDALNNPHLAASMRRAELMREAAAALTAAEQREAAAREQIAGIVSFLTRINSLASPNPERLVHNLVTDMQYITDYARAALTLAVEKNDGQ